MGKSAGAVTGGFIQDRAIRRGVSKGREGYGQAIGTLSAGKDEAISYLDPFRQVGQEALSPLSALLMGKTYNAATGQFSQISPEQRLSYFQESPDYQFRLQQGQKAALASGAASGMGRSGRALQELQVLGQGLASSEYGNFINRLSGLAGIGQNAANQSAAIAGDVAGNIANAQIGSGNLAMQGRIQRGQIWSDTAGVLGTEFDKYFTSKMLGQQGGMGGQGGQMPPENAFQLYNPLMAGGAGSSIYRG